MAYLFVHFKEKLTPDGEQVYFAKSQDGYNWEQVNDGNPVLSASLGECGCRDVEIVRLKTGGFVILTTDLSIANRYDENYNIDWKKVNSSGSKCLRMWKTDDLVNFSDEKLICFGRDDFGCMWAPEVYFEEETVFEKEDMKNLLLGVVGALPHEPDDSRYGVSVCKNIFKTSVIREKGIRFLSERAILSEDTLFMVDYIKSAECAVGVSGAYYCYCRNEDSLSKAYKKDRFEKSIVFLDELEKRIADTIEKEEYKIYLDRLIQGFGRILCSQEIMHARDEKIKFSHLKKRLKEICTQDKIQNVLKSYPWYRLPVKQAAFAFAMKHQLFLLQRLMVILRDR